MRNQNVRFLNWLLGAVLLGLLLASIFLTVKIFRAPREQAAQTQDQALVDQTSDVFRPLNYMQTDNNGTMALSRGLDPVRINDFNRVVSDATMTFDSTEKLSQDKLAEFVHRPNMQLCQYPDRVSVNYFDARYHQRIDKGNQTFDLLMLPLVAGNEVYLVNTHRCTVMTLKVRDLKLGRVKDYLANRGDQVPVTFQQINRRWEVAYTQPIAMGTYSYLVTRRDPSFYVSGLLGTLNRLDVDKNDDGVRYESKLTHQKVVYRPKVSSVTYYDSPTTSLQASDKNRRILASVGQINLLKLNFSDMAFYESHNEGKQIAYRTVISGVPVFYQADRGAIATTFNDAKAMQTTYSLNELGVPVPNDNPPVTLPATQTVLDQLHQAKVDDSQWKRLVVGYQWESNTSSAINLKPTWMILTDTGWQRFDMFMADHQHK